MVGNKEKWNTFPIKLFQSRIAIRSINNSIAIVIVYFTLLKSTTSKS
jgi:hypothetical protein